MISQACQVLKRDPLESIPQKFKYLLVLQAFLLVSSLSGGAQEREIQRYEAGADTSSVFHHAILCVPMLQLLMHLAGFTDQESSLSKTCAHVPSKRQQT